MASGGGGEASGSAAPWSGQEDSLKNLYARAADVTERQAQDPFASQGIVGKANAAKQVWGTDPMALGASYGMNPGQMDSMLRPRVRFRGRIWENSWFARSRMALLRDSPSDRRPMTADAWLRSLSGSGPRPCERLRAWGPQGVSFIWLPHGVS